MLYISFPLSLRKCFSASTLWSQSYWWLCSVPWALGSGDLHCRLWKQACDPVHAPVPKPGSRGVGRESLLPCYGGVPVGQPGGLAHAPLPQVGGRVRSQVSMYARGLGLQTHLWSWISSGQAELQVVTPPHQKIGLGKTWLVTHKLQGAGTVDFLG